MAGPRGESIFERYAYEYELLTALPVTLPHHPQITRIAVFAANKDSRREDRCADAAKVIRVNVGLMTRFTLEVRMSNRGRNNYDYILHSSFSPQPFMLEVKLTKSAMGNVYSERRLRCGNLLKVLTYDLPDDEQVMIWQKWGAIRKVIEENTGKDWDDLPDKHTLVFEPTRDLLKETARCLQSHGSGIMPRLWDHLYGMPILQIVFAKGTTYIQFLTPTSRFSPKEAALYDTPTGAGMVENFPSGTTRIRVHNSSRKISPTSLMAGISFILPAEDYEVNVIRYSEP